jgi:hypothetical protein
MHAESFGNLKDVSGFQLEPILQLPDPIQQLVLLRHKVKLVRLQRQVKVILCGSAERYRLGKVFGEKHHHAFEEDVLDEESSLLDFPLLLSHQPLQENVVDLQILPLRLLGIVVIVWLLI